MENLIVFLIYSALLIGVMLIAELSYRFLKLQTEWTRKIAHVGSGIVALTYPLYIHNHLIVLGLTLSFTLILFTCKKLGLFPSIFSVGRKSYGELLFVWSSWILFWLAQNTGESIYFYLPFSVVIFADPAAALIGTKIPIKKYRIFGHEKSYDGSFAFFIISFALSFYFLSDYFHQQSELFLYSIMHAALLTLTEAISIKGWDNFTIPVVSVIFLYFIL